MTAEEMSDEIVNVISTAIDAGVPPDACMKALLYGLAFMAGRNDETVAFIEEFAHQLPVVTEIAESFRVALAEALAHTVDGPRTIQ
jgi:hypothetical protein